MTKILIASNNRDKFSEIVDLILANSSDNLLVNHLASDKLIFAGDLIAKHRKPEAIEDGNSFLENSQIKAKYYGETFGYSAIADDSGFVIPAIDGLPGVYSARFATDKDGKINYSFAFNKIVDLLCLKNQQYRQKFSDNNHNDLFMPVNCYFVCNLTFFDYYRKKSYSFEGKIDGLVASAPRGNNGFGYDPIFIANNQNFTFAEIDPALKNKISHRAIAFRQLQNFLQNYHFHQ